jgi:hypothetical protein
MGVGKGPNNTHSIAVQNQETAQDGSHSQTSSSPDFGGENRENWFTNALLPHKWINKYLKGPAIWLELRKSLGCLLKLLTSRNLMPCVWMAYRLASPRSLWKYLVPGPFSRDLNRLEMHPQDSCSFWGLLGDSNKPCAYPTGVCGSAFCVCFLGCTLTQVCRMLLSPHYREWGLAPAFTSCTAGFYSVP